MLRGSARASVPKRTMTTTGMGQARASAAAAASRAGPPTSSSTPTSPPPLPLLVVGSINQDIVLKVERLPSPGETLAASSMEFFPGGKGCNQAAAAARLGHATSMIGRVGDDAAGEGLRRALEGAGVETRGVGVCRRRSEGEEEGGGKNPTHPPPPTGTAVVMLQPDGENSIVIVGGANAEGWGQEVVGSCGSGSGSGGSNNAAAAAAAAAASDSTVSVPPTFGALLLQREIPEAVNAAYARAAVASGVPVVLDAGGVDAPLSQELLSCLHTLSPNETELARLLRDSTDGKGQATTTTATTTLPPTESDAEVEAAARLLLSRSPPSLSAVLVKRGGKGSMLVERIEGEGGGGQASAASASSSSSSSSVRVFAQPAARVASVVDTTGAGDCFTAAYCVAWLRELGGGRGKEKNSEEEKDAEEEKREKVQQRLRFATAAAALCVTRAGALPSMPSQVEVERFLEGGGGFS